MPRRTVLSLLSAILLLSLAIRWPRSPHEVGVDSFFIHNLTTNILDNGNAEWTINVLSYFGWFPLSYPSANPFLLASGSSVTGFNVEATILLFSLLMGPVGTLGAFLMARGIRDDDGFALAVSLFYGLAPRFLAFTLWTASTRSLFMALLPVFIWSLFRYNRTRSYADLSMMAISIVMLAATHRLVVLVFVVILAFVAGVIAQVALRVLRIRFPSIILKNSVRRASPHIALSAVVGVAFLMLGATNVLNEYSHGEFASGSTLPIQILNLSVSLGRSVGIALPLSLAGLLVLTRQRNKTMSEPFLALVLVGLIPTLFLRAYTGFYILPFLSLFAGLGFVGVIRSHRHRRLVIGVVTVSILVITVGSSIYILEVEIDRTPAMPNDAYSTGLYVLRHAPDGTVIASEGLMGVRVAAISGARVLPVGGAGTTFQSPELIAYRFFSINEVNGQIAQSPLTSLTIDSDSLWVATNIQAEADWVQILDSPMGSLSPSLMIRYQPVYYLEDKAHPGQYLAFDNVYCSNLGLSVQHAAYTVYDNGNERLWWLGSPGAGSAPSPRPECP